LLGALSLRPGVDIGQCGGDHLIVDTLGAKLGSQRALTFSGVDPTRAHPLLGEVGIVDQSDIAQPVENPGAHVVGVAALGQLTFQLGAGAGPRGEQAQAQRPRLLLAGEFS
jgi:hypothetical protein